MKATKATKKDECSYSFSNAIRTLAMVPVAWNWYVPTLFSIMKAGCKNRAITRFFRVMALFLKVR